MYLKYKYLFQKIILGLILAGIFAYGVNRTLIKMTYIEFQNIGGESDEYIEIDNSSDIIIQNFTAPYNIISKIGIKIGTSERTNNSLWGVRISRMSDGKVLADESFSAAGITDNSYCPISLSSNLRLKNDDIYSLYIYPKKVTSESALAFAVTSEVTENTLPLMLNNEVSDKVLCIRVYGCNTDFFWLRFYIFGCCIIGIVAVRIFKLNKKGKSLLQDRVLEALFLFMLVFSLFYVFSKNGVTFTDENDNIRGGMIIAKGGILYRDYITQHTPVVYYLCAVFALLGAGSVEEFRLCYYVFIAVLFAIIYYRHSFYWERRRLFLIPVVITVVTTTLYGQGYMILSDNIQGMCMFALCMEFLRYVIDRKITLSRCVIVSACIWGGIGSAFVSVYALSIIVFAVLVIEIVDWRKKTYSLQFQIFLDRYGKLLAVIIVPFICAIVYFRYNNVLESAYDLIYIFNREVYSHYTRSGTGFTDFGYGSFILQPYFLGIKYYFSCISDNFNLLFSNMSVSGNIQLLLVILVSIILLRFLYLKHYFLGSALFLFLCCNVTRGYADFHGLAFWYVAVALIILYWPTLVWNYKFVETCRPVTSIGACLLIIYCLSSYVNNFCTNLFCQQKTISALEQYVVSVTEENECVFIDTYTSDSIYLLYKKRYPVNRLTYFLPWYMAWYERVAVEDLYVYKPDILIYNPDLVVWSVHTGYTPFFRKVAEENYKQLSESSGDGWKYCVWIRKGGG